MTKAPGRHKNNTSLRSDLKRGSLVRRLASGTAWAFLAKVLGTLSMLGVTAILARMLPTSEMGSYFLLASIVIFAGVLARFGLKQTIVRVVAEAIALRELGRARSGLRVALTIVLIGSITVSTGYYLVAGWLAESVFDDSSLAKVAGLTSVWIIFVAFQTPLAETFRGMHDLRSAVLLDGVVASVILFAILLLWWQLDLALSFDEAVLLSVVAVGIGVFVAAYLFRAAFQTFGGTGHVTHSEIMGIAAPIFLTNVTNQFMASVSLWIVAALFVPSDVALYAAAWKLVLLTALPLTLVNVAVQPTISELNIRGESVRLQAALRGTATLAALPGGLLLAVLVLFGADVLELVFGESYAAASDVLVILSAGYLVNLLTGSCGAVLNFTGHQKEFMYLTVLSSVFAIGAAFLGAEYFGLLGVAGAMSLGRVLQMTLAWLLVKRLTGLWTHVTLSPTTLHAAMTRLRQGV